MNFHKSPQQNATRPLILASETWHGYGIGWVMWHSVWVAPPLLHYVAVASEDEDRDEDEDEAARCCVDMRMRC